MSVERKPVIKKLSKGVLDLKFMKKSKEKVKQQEEDEERRTLYQDQLANLHSSEDKIVLVGSHYDVMDYLPCRLSFGGVDAQIEKLNATKLRGLYEPVKEELVVEKEEDVTKEEMAEHFSSLNENLAKRFNPDQYKGYKRPNDKISSSPRGKRGRFQRGRRGGSHSSRGGFEQRKEEGDFEQSPGRGRGFEHNNRGRFERGRKGIKRDSRGEYSSGNEDSFRLSEEKNEGENRTDTHSQERGRGGIRNSKRGKRGHFKNNRMKSNSNNKSDYDTSVDTSCEFSSRGKQTKFET